MVYPNDQQIRADKFIQIFLDIEAWKQTAHHLLSAAALLEPKVEEYFNRLRSGASGSSSGEACDDEFVAIYFMLCAFAIENLLSSFRLN